MSLAFLMELIVGTAVGLGIFRERFIHRASGLAAIPGWVTWLDVLAESLSVGVGDVVGIGTWVEAARRRGPQTWGPGRWTWSAVAAYLVLRITCLLVVGTGMGHWRTPSQLLRASLGFLLDQENFFAPVPWFLAALAFTRWVARTGGTPAADGRERAGRAYAALLVVVAVVVTVLRSVGFDPGASIGMIY
jgi:hypothetical protein